MSIETLRGFAIILVVMVHVIGSGAEGGLHVAGGSWYRYVFQIISLIHMPLFTVVAGYVYAMHPVAKERAVDFLTGKARRLLVPMVSVSTVQYLFSVYGPGVSRPHPLGEIWRIYLFPFDQFWFLQAIVLVFLSVVVVELAGLLNSKWGWTACLLASATLYLAGPTNTTFFSVDGWCSLLVFFILGVGLYRFDAMAHGKAALGIASAVLVISMGLYQLMLLGRLDPGPWVPWIVLGCGLGATFLLVRLRLTWQPLASLGGYAFTIYLLHSFGVVAARLLSRRLVGLNQTDVLFVVCLLSGLAMPIVGHKVLGRYTLTRRVLLGER